MANVIVIGSINMDIVASTARLPTPGETVIGSVMHFVPGGKGANQAIAAARAGAEVLLVANVGDDRLATELIEFLVGTGVRAEAVRVAAGVSTGVALIVVDGRGENSIVVVPGANATLEPEAVDRATIERGDVVVAQFEVPQPTVAVAFRRARSRGATTVLNAAPARGMSRELHDLVDVLVVNETELDALAGTSVASEPGPDEIRVAISRLGRSAATTVVTLGARGAVARIGDRELEVAGRAVEVVDTTGAGDCFVGSLAARLAAGATMDAALDFANVAASLCVGRVGAGPSMPTLGEIRERSS